MRGCPAVDAQGRVFACVRNRLLMFSAGDGTPQWEYATAGPIPRSPAIGPDGNIRIHSGDGCLHVVTPNCVRVFEPVALGKPPGPPPDKGPEKVPAKPLGWASPLVDHLGNTWISWSEGGLIKIDAKGNAGDGPFLRTRRRFDCTGLIHAGVLYIGSEDHYVRAVPLDADRGENLWAGSPELGRTGCAINCPLALADGPQLLVASQDDRLHGFALDGRQLWSVPMPGQVLSSPVVGEDGTIFLGISQNLRHQDPRGVLVAVDRDTHQITWQCEADGPIECTPAIGDDGILYFGDNCGTIHAVDRRGKHVWKENFSVPVRSAGTILANGLVAFGLDDGSLVVLKCSSQALCAKGWPKLQCTLGQSGLAPAS
jgi:outer membrane protein assembly factor BamB